MLSPFWAEYARVQRLVEIGAAHEGQLNSLLECIPNDGEEFDLRDTRRQLKNLGRNLDRKERHRKKLLKRNSDCLVPNPSETPVAAAARREQEPLIQHAAGEDWPMLRDTLDGNYHALAKEMNIPVGTLKSWVSRARIKLRSALIKVI